MPTIEVLVNGRRHAVQCGQGEEARVRQLASYVDRRIAELARGQSQVGDARLMLMASLVVADELSDAFDEIKRLRANLEGQGSGERTRGRRGDRAGGPADRGYCRRTGERLTRPQRVLPSALGPQHPGANVLCMGAVPAEALVSVLRRPPATAGHRGKQVPTAAAAPRRSFRPKRSPLSTPESLVRRKAALRAEQRRKRRRARCRVCAPRRPRQWPTGSCASSGCRLASSPATGRSRTNSTRARPWPGSPGSAIRSRCRACRGGAGRLPSTPGTRATRCSPARFR